MDEAEEAAAEAELAQLRDAISAAKHQGGWEVRDGGVPATSGTTSCCARLRAKLTALQLALPSLVGVALLQASPLSSWGATNQGSTSCRRPQAEGGHRRLRRRAGAVWRQPRGTAGAVIVGSCKADALIHQDRCRSGGCFEQLCKPRLPRFPVDRCTTSHPHPDLPATA